MNFLMDSIYFNFVYISASLVCSTSCIIYHMTSPYLQYFKNEKKNFLGKIDNYQILIFLKFNHDDADLKTLLK